MLAQLRHWSLRVWLMIGSAEQIFWAFCYLSNCAMSLFVCFWVACSSFKLALYSRSMKNLRRITLMLPVSSFLTTPWRLEASSEKRGGIKIEAWLWAAAFSGRHLWHHQVQTAPEPCRDHLPMQRLWCWLLQLDVEVFFAAISLPSHSFNTEQTHWCGLANVLL